jgi:hypothetical protein
VIGPLYQKVKCPRALGCFDDLRQLDWQAAQPQRWIEALDPTLRLMGGITGEPPNYVGTGARTSYRTLPFTFCGSSFT